MSPPKDRIDVYVHVDTHVAREQLDRIEAAVADLVLALTTQGETIMADLSALQAEVTENGEVGASAAALLAGLSQQLKDALAANDPAAVQALVDELDANTAALAAAVEANTTPPPA